MSHELRTPLNAIIGYASLLDDEVWGPILAQQHEHIGRLKVSAKHLLALIDEVLTLARLDAEREVFELDAVDSRSLLEEVLTFTMPLAASKRLSLEIVHSEETTPMTTDHRKVLQILINLVGNAIKFTDRRRRHSPDIDSRRVRDLFRTRHGARHIARERRSRFRCVLAG